MFRDRLFAAFWDELAPLVDHEEHTAPYVVRSDLRVALINDVDGNPMLPSAVQRLPATSAATTHQPSMNRLSSGAGSDAEEFELGQDLSDGGPYR